MRTLIGTILLILTCHTSANTIDLQTFHYDGTQDSAEIFLKTEKSQMGTRPENQETICYRQELSGYRTVCTGGLQPGELPPPSLNLQQPPRCWAEPVYRAVPYSCIQSFNVPVLIKEFDVEARVSLSFKNSSQLIPDEGLRIILKGDELSFEVKSSNKFFVVKKESRSSIRKGSVQMIDAKIEIELIEAEPFLKGLKLLNLHMEQNKLLFQLKGIVPQKNLGLSLSVSNSKNSESQSDLFNRVLSRDEVEFIEVDRQLKGTVDLDRLEMILPQGKYNLSLTAAPLFEGQLMNGQEFPELSSSKVITLKRR